MDINRDDKVHRARMAGILWEKDPTKVKSRSEVVAETKSWIGVPYVTNAMVKDRRGGVDCAMILIGVYGATGWIDPKYDPRPYPAYWHLHKSEEWYLNIVQSFGYEISEKEVLPADIVVFKVGRVFAHGAIIIDWPLCVSARAPNPVGLEDIMRDKAGKHALAYAEKKFFRVVTKD